MTTARSTDRQMQERQRSVDTAVHSTELEGGHVSERARRDLDDYVAGHITSDELVARGLSRYQAR